MGKYKFPKSENTKRIEEINKKIIPLIIKNNFGCKIIKIVRYISHIYIKDVRREYTFPGYYPFVDAFRMTIDFKSNKFLSIYDENKDNIFEDKYLKIGNYLMERKIVVKKFSNRFSIDIKYEEVVCVLNSEREAKINKLLKKYFNQDYMTSTNFSIYDILIDHSDNELLAILVDDAAKALDILEI